MNKKSINKAIENIKNKELLKMINKNEKVNEEFKKIKKELEKEEEKEIYKKEIYEKYKKIEKMIEEKNENLKILLIMKLLIYREKKEKELYNIREEQKEIEDELTYKIIKNIEKNKKIIIKRKKKYENMIEKYKEKEEKIKKIRNIQELITKILEEKKKKNKSKGEKRIRKELDNKVEIIIEEKKFGYIKEIKNLRYDFFIIVKNEKNYIPGVIEYDGLQHWQGYMNESVYIINKNDRIKNEYLIKNKISILRIDNNCDEQQEKDIINEYIEKIKKENFTLMNSNNNKYDKSNTPII